MYINPLRKKIAIIKEYKFEIDFFLKWPTLDSSTISTTESLNEMGFGYKLLTKPLF
jgi:hypothetical protein